MKVDDVVENDEEVKENMEELLFLTLNFLTSHILVLVHLPFFFGPSLFVELG